jgi:hypothetical protein
MWQLLKRKGGKQDFVSYLDSDVVVSFDAADSTILRVAQERMEATRSRTPAPAPGLLLLLLSRAPSPACRCPSHCRAGSARRRSLPERRTGPARCRRKSGRRAGSRRWSSWSAPRPLRPSGRARVQASGAKEERSASAQHRRGRPPWCHRHLQQEKLILQ